MTTPQEPGARLVDLDELNATLGGITSAAPADAHLDVRRTPDEWSAAKGIEVRDPDGWRNEGRDWNEPVTEAEFNRLCGPSTIRPLRPEETLGNPQGLTGTDVTLENHTGETGEDVPLIAMAPPQEQTPAGNAAVVAESIRFATGGVISSSAAHLPGRITTAGPPPFAGPPITEETPVDEDRPIQGYCAKCGQATLVLPAGASRIRCTFEFCTDADISARVLDRGQQALSFLNLAPTPVDQQRQLRGVQGPGAVLVDDLTAPTANVKLDRGSDKPVYSWTCPRCDTPHESHSPEMTCSGRPGAFHRPERADPELAIER